MTNNNRRAHSPAASVSNDTIANDNADGKGNVTELPVIDKPKGTTVKVGVFNPSLFNCPSLPDLVACMMILGIQTRPISGQNKQGDLVDVNGNTVIPASLRRYFALLDGEVVPAPEATS